MIYRQSMAMAVKVGGRILREDGENVYLPFGSEFSILMKNLSHKRALVNLYIDDRLVTKNGLVINANSSVDLERFIEDNLREGNKFKFIERSGKIENHRGIGICDGIVRLEYAFDISQPYYVAPMYQNFLANSCDTTFTSTGNPPQNGWGTAYSANSVTRSDNPDVAYAASSMDVSYSANHVRSMKGIVTERPPETRLGNIKMKGSKPKNEAGITVEGSKSTQSFITVSDFPVGEKQSLILRLLGDVNQQKIEAPVVVKRSVKCKTCGTMNKGHAKFCHSCGTSLVKY